MPEDSFQTQYNVTKKNKLKEFYESKKNLIYFSIFAIIVIIGAYSYYKIKNENEKILLSESYIQAKVYLENKKKIEALEILKRLALSKDSTYSTLSFFMILDENLINNEDEISKLFDHLLKNNKYEEEIKNLLLYKKALYISNYIEESKLLEQIKPLLNNKESIWNGHALLLIADFYYSKNEFIKAKDFYRQIIITENLHPDLYLQAKSKLIFIADD